MRSAPFGGSVPRMKEAIESNRLEARIAGHTFFRGLKPHHLELLADSAMLKSFKAGDVIFRQGDPANRFYLIESGQVQLESQVKDSAPVPLQRIGLGDVLGWSWLFPPYYWQFDARAITDTTTIFFYGTWLRDSCERDHDFGYTMLKRMSAVVIQRLQAARQRLVDLDTKRG